jgi:hypothetical protein
MNRSISAWLKRLALEDDEWERLWPWRNSLWFALFVFGFMFIFGAPFFWVAARVGRKRWYVAGIVWSIPFPCAVIYFAYPYNIYLLSAMYCLGWVGSLINAFVIRNEYLALLACQQGRPDRVPIPSWMLPAIEARYGAQGFERTEWRPNAPTKIQTTAPSVSPGYAPPAAPGAPLVYVNRASERMIATLPGFSPYLAARAAAQRTKRGGFRSVEEFGLAIGLRPHEIERIRPRVVITPLEAPSLAGGARMVDY